MWLRRNINPTADLDTIRKELAFAYKLQQAPPSTPLYKEPTRIGLDPWRLLGTTYYYWFTGSSEITSTIPRRQEELAAK